jgi:beta-lactamase class A
MGIVPVRNTGKTLNFKKLLMVVAWLCALPWAAASSAADSAYPALRQSADPEMQAQLVKGLDRLGLSKAVRDGELSVALVDVTDPEHPRLSQVNGDRMMYAASLPKIAILLAAFQRIHDGSMTLDDSTRKTLVDMIRYSNNHAATAMIRRVGKPYINQVLTSPRYHLYDPAHNGGLWVGKEYGASGVWRRDPLHHLSHGATAMQVARYYYLLDTGRLVSPKASREMLSIMSKPGIHHKFVGGLLARYPDAEIYRKSGTWRDFHADSALVEHKGRRYIAVGLAHNSHGGQWLKKLIVVMDNIIERTPRARYASLQ